MLSVAERLGSRAAAHADGPGLTGRELEVVRLVAVGRTNREIATELFLSPRTVDMHVRNLLRKLDCRSRVEAAHRAGELDLLTRASPGWRTEPADIAGSPLALQGARWHR
jgi:DNA-binding CsgD family transcriptional regulator